MRDGEEAGPEESGAETVPDGASPGLARTVPISPQTPELPADAVLDRYVVRRRLGAGGMGVVYEAYDPELDRPVAIKLIHPRRTTDATNKARLLREARAMAKLSHPAVVPVFDVGSHEGHLFVAMELVAGQTLATWLRENRPGWRAALAALVRAGRGLAAAHSAGVVHRDFKPDNVLVAADGRIAVTDFGLARLALGGDEQAGSCAVESGSPPLSALTQSGAVLGTPAYMAPEQHVGGPADARSDQFSFCVALYEAVYGEPPFRCDDADGVPSVMVLAAEVTLGHVRPPPAAHRVPGWLRRILLRGLSVEPDDRWPSMDSLLDAIEATPRRRRALLSGTVVLVAGAAVAVLLALTRPTAGSEDSCAGAGLAAVQVWDASHRGALRTAFVESGRPFAGDFADRIERRFDEWTGRWRDTRVAICRRVRTAEMTTEAAHMRVDCLERQLDQLRLRVALLTERPPPDVLERALDVAVLPDVDECGQGGEGMRLPADPARRARVLQVLRQVDELELQRTGMRGRGMAGRAAELVAQAERLDWPPLVNYAGAVAATIDQLGGDCKRALETAARVAEAAPAEGQTRLAAWMWEIRLNCTAELDDTAGLDHALLAGRALARQVGGSTEEVELLVAIGAAEAARGRMAEAEQACRAATTASERLAADAAARAEPPMCLSSIYAAQGRNADALAAAEVTLAARERALGPHHTDVAFDLQNLAIAYQRVGRFREAVDAKRRALGIEERLWGRDHLRVAGALQSLGWALVEVGARDEAHRHAMRALAIVERTPPPAPGELILFYLLAARSGADLAPHEIDRLHQRAADLCAGAGPFYAWTCVGVHVFRAEAMRERRQCRRAQPLYRQALELLRSIEGVDPAAEAEILAGRGLCASDLGRHREALGDLERAESLVRDDAPRETAAAIKHALGRGLAAAGRDRARAIELLQAARALYAASGQHLQAKIDEVDRLLGELHARR